MRQHLPNRRFKIDAVRRWMGLCLALMMAASCLTPVGAAAFWPFTSGSDMPESRATDESADIRVLLKSLGDVQALGMTLEGVYSVESDPGFRFARGASLTVAVSGKDLLMTCGALTINMGDRFTLTRHPDGDSEGDGIVIHETGREARYLGDISFINEGGNISALVTLDIEDYLYGVVPYEMSDSFPTEALKAQAVAARTYAMSRKSASRGYDVVDTTADQVYRGYNPDYENTIAAVDATRGVVGLYKDRYATCYFTASNGGQTALPDQLWGNPGDYGWLDVRDDPYDIENPSSPVKALTLSADPQKWDKHLIGVLKSGLTEALSARGYSDETRDITILSIDGMTPAAPKFGDGNRMFASLRVTMTVEAKKLFALSPTPNPETTPMFAAETVTELTADLDFYGDLKPNYGLKISGSDCEILSVVPLANEREAASGESPDAFRVESRRFGHGVGMSQRGAQQMARAHGKTWRDILAFYYPGMTLVTMEYQRTPRQPLDALPASVGKARPRPTPKPTPAPLPPLAEGESYAVVALGSKGSTLNVREQPSTDSGVKGTLANGQRVILVGVASEGWAQIKTAELTGYASTDYLKSSP